MEAGFICSMCPQIAVHCCLCIPQRTYSCEKCVSQHVSKGGVHTLAPATAPDWVTTSTLPEFSERLKVAARLKNMLEALGGKLETELSALGETVNQRYYHQVKVLYEAWETVNRDAGECYRKVRGEIERVKEEVARIGDKKEWALSYVAQKLVDIGLHGDFNRCPFFDIGSEAESGVRISINPVSLPTESPLKRVLEKWRTPACHCSDCASARLLTNKAPTVPTPPIPKTAFSLPQYQPIPTVDISSKVRNLSDVSSIRHRSGEHSSVEVPPAKHPKLEYRSEPAVRTCPFCSNPTRFSACQQCAKPQSSWHCYDCGDVNASNSRRCSSCGMSKQWEEYLKSKDVEMSKDGKKWRCLQCNGYSELALNTCQFCGEENEVITKGRRGEGNQIGIMDQIHGFLKALL